MNLVRRRLLKAVIAAPVVAAFPWYWEAPIEDMLVGWRSWHSAVILNDKWMAHIAESLDCIDAVTVIKNMYIGAGTNGTAAIRTRWDGGKLVYEEIPFERVYRPE